MAIIPIRGVGAKGLVYDRSPFNLDLVSWSRGNNFRFADGDASRYSVFKTAYPSLTLDYDADEIVVGTAQFYAGTGVFRTLVVTRSYDIREITASTNTSVSPVAGPTLVASADDRVTSTILGGVTFLNRRSTVPLYRTPADATFDELPGWDENDLCRTLRSYKDFCVALNVTKGSTVYPSMIKWSNATEYGSPPPDWDTAEPSSLAGETVINSVEGEFLDGMVLGDSFIVYSDRECIRMDFIGAPLVFAFTDLFPDVGVIAQNCVVGLDNKHYVFGADDIYVHDGVSKQSLTRAVDDTGLEFSTVQQRIFGTLDFDKKARCHTVHYPDKNEIIFCYPSVIDEVAWVGTEDCNVGAVYNYVSRTWSFIDLPSTVGSIPISSNETQDWPDLDIWGSLPTWSALSGKSSSIPAVVSSGLGVVGNPPKILLLDDLVGGRSDKIVDTTLLFPAFIERSGLDLDDISAQIVGQKMLRRIFPQIVTPDSDNQVFIQLGRNQFSGSDLIWSESRLFDPRTMYKQDSRNTGRYLAIRIDLPAGSYARISGYDVEIIPISGR